MDKPVMLLSCKSVWAEMILKGEKNFELRRKRPRLKMSFSILLYAAGKGVVGQVWCCGLGLVDPNNLILWDTGQTHEENKEYLKGAASAVGMLLTDPVLYERIVPLPELRKVLGSRWLPPQSWHYLTPEQAAIITAKGQGEHESE